MRREDGFSPSRVRASRLFGSPITDVRELSARKRAIADAKYAEEQREKEEEAAGHVFECGCCFGDYIFSKVTSVLYALRLHRPDAASSDRWCNALKHIYFARTAHAKTPKQSWEIVGR